MATAADFETVEVPNIGSIGRMVPVHETNTVFNVGANWWAAVYTVPSGRILALDWAEFVATSGVIPTIFHIRVFNTPTAGWPIRQAPAGVNQPTMITNTIWLPSGSYIQFQITGGDATTDLLWSISGRLFDWTDFAS